MIAFLFFILPLIVFGTGMVLVMIFGSDFMKWFHSELDHETFKTLYSKLDAKYIGQWDADIPNTHIKIIDHYSLDSMRLRISGETISFSIPQKLKIRSIIKLRQNERIASMSNSTLTKLKDQMGDTDVQEETTDS